MKVRAAVLWEQPGRWKIEDAELDDPKDGEVLVEMVATGLCHSDAHMTVAIFPVRPCRFARVMRGPALCGRWDPGCVT
jgi:S-(hydroxymethyl)glutathione dehydrogenase/alcohol dehydrogenase